MSIDFTLLRAQVRAAWRVDERRYPLIPPKNQPLHRRAFIAGHVALHVAKTAGKIVALVEPLDHGKPALPPVVLAEQIAKMLINLAQLAHVLGVSDKDILAAIREWEAEHEAPPDDVEDEP